MSKKKDIKINQNGPKVTKEMVKFAKLLDEGMSPEEAARRVTIKSTKTSMSKPKSYYVDKSIDLIRKCHEAFLVDMSKLVPRASQKLAELLEAEDPVYYQGEEVGTRPNYNVQLRAAEKIVESIKPAKEDTRPSLIQQVIQINNYE